MNLDWGANSELGGRSEQQDKYFIANLDVYLDEKHMDKANVPDNTKKISVKLFSIYDGHGTFGSKISEYVRNSFKNWFFHIVYWNQ